MTVEEVHNQLKLYKAQGLKMMVTSSFQTHSIPLLHILSTSGVEIDYYFIHTGFHFAETLTFKKEIETLLGISFQDIRSNTPLMNQKENGKFLYNSDPDYCCYINKTKPMEPYLNIYDVWISGVRGDQNSNRANMQTEAETAFKAKRFHPMLDWNSKSIYEYRMAHDLPEHPLEAQGYFSIGCAPCTRKIDLDNDRGGRWFGMKKTECGLHTDLK